MATPLTIKQGMPFRFLVRVQRKNVNGVLVPMELTGCKVRLQARINTSDREAVLNLSSLTSGIVVNAAAGTFEVVLSAAQTTELVWGRRNVVAKAVYHCEIEPADGQTFRVLEGVITLDPEVVR